MNAEYLLGKLAASGIRTGVEEAETLAAFAEFLKTENGKYNLTAISDDAEIAEKHFADCLAAVDLIPENASVADIGSGAGFPAVPLAAVRKDLKITAIESVGKKARFIETASRKFGLGNLKVENVRIEDFARGAGRSAFDCVTARAVAPLATLLEYAVPLVKTGGAFIAYKGRRADEEVKAAEEAARVFHAKIEKVSRYVLENGEERVIIVYRKYKDTAAVYPRGQNLPRKRPIGGSADGEKIR